MIPWVLLDTATTPDGQSLRLKQRGAEFSIMLGTNELMNSRLSGSEEALAKLSIQRIASVSSQHILIGGLGMGFTLRAALAELGPGAKVTVAELIPAVVAWARGPMSPVFGDCLSDPRVTVRIADVGALIGAARYDAILLDVDNGPEGLTVDSNDALYAAAGLRRAHAALNPGGVLAVWSSGPDSGFTRRLRQAGFAVEEANVRAHGKRGARHVIWLAMKNRG
ncbi:MAG: spermidine synthase [Rhizobiaceae bacterium]